ncbi:hypothetical protein DSO57_1008455 [Entomophthora muscae]|uniref:Uncharacterized protein n=1 Tax=Entomophthora muscae TaxID=34485 RepID=A0ACC2U530_9FUNG|nr:hypothetical protein DSO57_1008455 [Entomophthora muscae]
MFAFIHNSTIFCHPHICSLLATKSDNLALHAGDSSYFPLPTVPPAQDFSKLGFVYITIFGLINQAVPHTGSWCSLATSINYLVIIAPIVYLAFYVWPASPLRVQTDSGMGHEDKDYTPEKILELDPLAHIQSAVRYNLQGLWVSSTPKLLRGKFKYLPSYKLDMELPVTPKPMPTSLPNPPTDHTSKLFGIVYIIFTGVIDTIILANSPWSRVGKSFSYLFKLASLLWWALPVKNLAQIIPETNRPASQDWIPDIMAIYFKPGTLSPKMLLFLGASCMLLSLIIPYYTYKTTTNLTSSMWKNANLNNPKKPNTVTADTTKTPSYQLQNVIVNQFLTKLEMPHMGKLILKEAQRAMPVLCLHFQANTPSYSSDTKKVLGVAFMLSEDVIDWFGKATAEDVEFCLDYAKFEAELMATREDCNT